MRRHGACVKGAATACGARAPGAVAGATDAEPDDAAVLGPDSIQGRVVDVTTSRPLPGRTVTIGTESRVTDSTGSFVFESAPATYDATVVEPNGATVSVFRGVHRRDPILTHRASPVPDTKSWSANLSGNLSGGAAYPLDPADLVTVYFFAPEVDEHVFIGGLLAPAIAGPAYGLSTFRGTEQAPSTVKSSRLGRSREGRAPEIRSGLPVKVSTWPS